VFRLTGVWYVVQHNGAAGVGGMAVVRALQGGLQLRTLDLSHNPLFNAVPALARQLERQKTLTDLNLSSTVRPCTICVCVCVWVCVAEQSLPRGEDVCVSRVAFRDPSHRSPVNSGQRFNRGLDRGEALLNVDGKPPGGQACGSFGLSRGSVFEPLEPQMATLSP